MKTFEAAKEIGDFSYALRTVILCNNKIILIISIKTRRKYPNIVYRILLLALLGSPVLRFFNVSLIILITEYIQNNLRTHRFSRQLPLSENILSGHRELQCVKASSPSFLHARKRLRPRTFNVGASAAGVSVGMQFVGVLSFYPHPLVQRFLRDAESFTS